MTSRAAIVLVAEFAFAGANCLKAASYPVLRGCTVVDILFPPSLFIFVNRLSFSEKGNPPFPSLVLFVRCVKLSIYELILTRSKILFPSGALPEKKRNVTGEIQGPYQGYPRKQLIPSCRLFLKFDDRHVQSNKG